MLLRIFTALVLIPLVVSSVLISNTLAFGIGSAVLLILAAVEWANLCHLIGFKKIAYIVVFALILVSLYHLNIPSLLVVGSLFWIFPLWWIIHYHKKVPVVIKHPVYRAFIGFFVLSMAWYAFYILHQLPNGPIWMLVLFVLVWSADSFAYFAGKFWGKKLWVPHISPKKTWEGFWGGLIGASLVALIMGLLMKKMLPTKPEWLMSSKAWVGLGLAILIILISMLGDLFESIVKRVAGMKDSGKLIPGHGGVLDRVDSLIATAPVYTLCLVWLQGL